MNILRKYNIKAKKALGQNFLVDEQLLQEVISQVEVSGKNIIEVGPGYGALTEKICEKKPKKLTLVELDTDMITILEDRKEKGDFQLEGIDFSIQNIDVLKFEPTVADYQVLANIPYYITSPILRHFLYDVEYKAKSMLILMQKDVGDKILDGQGYTWENGEKTEKNTKKLKTSVLSLFISKKMYVREIAFVPNTAFVPAPKVDSSFLYFEKHELYTDTNDEIFFQFIKKAFSSPRKKLSKNLEVAGYKKEYIEQVFEKYNIDQNIRPEKIDIALYCKLIGDFHKKEC